MSQNNLDQTDLDVNADEDEDDVQALPQVSRMDSLKKKADAMGIKYKGNISEETLARKIETHLSNEKAEVEEDEEEVVAKPTKVIPHSERQRSQRLIRIVVHPVDPRRTQLDGEIVATGNSVIGMVSKYVPFNAEAGYHVPEIIYHQLKDTMFTEFYKIYDKDNNEVVKTRQKKAFIIEVLDPLTEDEIHDIAVRQQGQSGEE